MVSWASISTALPGWDLVLFIVIFLAFAITSSIVTFRFFSKKRWPYSYVVMKDISGMGPMIAQKGSCRIISFGDGGEEVFLLKESKKIRVAFGKRIGTNQVGWIIANDGLWYSFNFGDFDKKLREMGVLPTHINVRLAMSAMRKGLDKRYEETNKWDKIMPLIMMGSILLALAMLGGMIWWMSKKNVEVATINAGGTQKVVEGMKEVSTVMAHIDSLFSNLNFKGNPELANVTTGSGLNPA